MNGSRQHRTDVAHHHPRVHRLASGPWVWSCGCGSASCRNGQGLPTWRLAVLAALHHSGCLT